MARLEYINWRAAVTAGFAIAFGLSIVGLVWVLAYPLTVLVLAITIADAFSPIVAWLQKWMPRAWAAVLSYVAVFGLLAAVAWFVVPLLMQQAQELGGRIPGLLQSGERLFSSWDATIRGQVTELIRSASGRVSGYLVALPLKLGSALFDVILIVFLSFYWLLWSPQLASFVRTLVPARRRGDFDGTLDELSHAMGGYLRATAIDAAIVGALAGLGLWAAGINYPVVLGLITLVGELVPYIGPILSAIPAILIGLLQSPSKALLALIVYTAILQIEGHVLAPNIMRSQTNLPQSLVLFALAAGASVGGIPGAIAAIPLAGALHVLTLRLVVPAIRSWGATADDKP